jgi:hypothetical protein
MQKTRGGEKKKERKGGEKSKGGRKRKRKGGEKSKGGRKRKRKGGEKDVREMIKKHRNE